MDHLLTTTQHMSVIDSRRQYVARTTVIDASQATALSRHRIRAGRVSMIGGGRGGRGGGGGLLAGAGGGSSSRLSFISSGAASWSGSSHYSAGAPWQPPAANGAERKRSVVVQSSAARMTVRSPAPPCAISDEQRAVRASIRFLAVAFQSDNLSLRPWYSCVRLLTTSPHLVGPLDRASLASSPFSLYALRYGPRSRSTARRPARHSSTRRRSRRGGGCGTR